MKDFGKRMEMRFKRDVQDPLNQNPKLAQIDIAWAQ